MLEIFMMVCWFEPDPRTNVHADLNYCQVHEAGKLKDDHCGPMAFMAVQGQLKILHLQHPDKYYKAMYWCEPHKEQS